jgi:uncharacterized protein YecE (DUF72 family)
MESGMDIRLTCLKDTHRVEAVCDAADHACPTSRTADEVYVRLHGPKRWYRHDYSKDELAIWADRIKASGAKRAGTPDFETVVTDLLTGRYRNPQRVIALNVAEGWSRDASADIAHELRRRCDLRRRDIPDPLQPFVDRQEGRYSDIQLRLPMRLF